MEKFLENLQEAEKNFKTIDHILYVTFPLVKDKRLLLKIVQETKGVITHCITSILQYEYIYKRISLYRNSKENFKTFTEKCAPRYKISAQELSKISELFDFVDKHKASPFEFVKEEKVIILSENLNPTTLTLEKTKEFLLLAKEILRKTKETMSEYF